MMMMMMMMMMVMMMMMMMLIPYARWDDHSFCSDVWVWCSWRKRKLQLCLSLMFAFDPEKHVFLRPEVFRYLGKFSKISNKKSLQFRQEKYHHHFQRVFLANMFHSKCFPEKKHVCQHFSGETLCVFPDLVCLILRRHFHLQLFRLLSLQVEDDVVILRPLQGTAIIFNGRLPQGQNRWHRYQKVG